MALALVLQDDVMGASSELSLSCISLSGEWSKGVKAWYNKNFSPYMFRSFVVCGVNEGEWQEIEDWSSEQPFLSSYPHILRTTELHNFRPLSAFAHSFAQSGSSEVIIQSSPTFVQHIRHSGVPLLAFSSVACSSCSSGLPQSNTDCTDGTSESFSCPTPNTADDTCTLSDPFLSTDCIWQPADDDREDKMIFFTVSGASWETVSAAAAATFFTWTWLSHRETERIISSRQMFHISRR